MYNKIFRSFFALILVTGLMAIQAPISVHAATLTVTNNNDNGPGSLRQAIIDASDGDTIDFDANYTITLNSQLPIINKTLTINGNGAANTIIEASDCNPVTLPGGCLPANDRVFEIDSTGNLTLDGVTVRHGRCSNGTACSTINFVYLGGGILNQGALAIKNSNISGNSVVGYGGAGIANDQGTVAITNSTFSGNSLVDDGGTEGGGAILNSYGTLTVISSIFSNNSSGTSGGAIKCSSGMTTITDSTFSNNSAGTSGGGVAACGGTVTNSSFSGNNADTNGGAISGAGAITNSIFSGNSAIQSGGGIYQATSVTYSTISGNNAGDDGGGIHNFYNMTITNSTLSGNTAGRDGGGVVSSLGTVNISNATISNNSAIGLGGGIYVDGDGGLGIIDSTATITNSTLSGNSAGSAGGGIIVALDATLNFANTIIANSTMGGDCLNDNSTIGTNANNLVEDGSCSSSISGDPILGPLQDNGGPTQTMALLPGSSAIDAGNDAICPATDQRGVARPQGAACDIGAFELEVAISTIEVSVDIKPGSGTNPINLKSKGKIAVAILSTPDFDAPSRVDVSSLTFGRFGNEESLAFCNENGEDVNGDGLLDLVCHFYTRATGFQVGDLEGVLKGRTIEGIPLNGQDGVNILK